MLANISKRLELSCIQPRASWQPRIIAFASGVDVFGVVLMQRSRVSLSSQAMILRTIQIITILNFNLSKTYINTLDESKTGA